MNHPKDLKNILLNESKTLLGVGPMSVNLTDVVIDISNKYSIPIQLIASRRQVESKEYGSGYVSRLKMSLYYLKEIRNIEIKKEYF